MKNPSYVHLVPASYNFSHKIIELVLQLNKIKANPLFKSLLKKPKSDSLTLKIIVEARNINHRNRKKKGINDLVAP